MVYYKIRRKSDPTQYLKGTPVYRSYDGTGRIFQKIGQLRSFITQVLNTRYGSNDIGDWEVVELEMVVRETRELHEIVKPEKIVQLLTR